MSSTHLYVTLIYRLVLLEFYLMSVEPFVRLHVLQEFNSLSVDWVLHNTCLSDSQNADFVIYFPLLSL